MHVSRTIHLPAGRPARLPSERGFAAAVVLSALLLLSGSLWLSQHGVSFVPCGEDLAAACVLR